jgi:tetratricopeptide (TPR) repeat protein
VVFFVLGGMLAAQEVEQLTVPPKVAIPSAEEVAEFLKKEPIALENWPTWRGRLLDWINDRGTATDPAFDAARKFIKNQANDKGEFAEALAKDHLAWYLLARSTFFDAPKDADKKVAAQKAEKAVRQSIALDGNFAQAHRDLATYLLNLEEAEPEKGATDKEVSPRFREALNELKQAQQLNHNIFMVQARVLAGLLAYKQKRYALADTMLMAALAEDPTLAPRILRQTGEVVLLNSERNYPSTVIGLRELISHHPEDGHLACYMAVALFGKGDIQASMAEFKRAAKLGVDPTKVIPSSSLQNAALRVLQDPQIDHSATVTALGELAEQFPQDGAIASFHAYALLVNRDGERANEEFLRARQLGADPAKHVSPEALRTTVIRILNDKQITWPQARTWVEQLVGIFPEDSTLACLHAVVLRNTGDFQGAVQELDRAEGLGLDPKMIDGLPLGQIRYDWLQSRVKNIAGQVLLGFGAVYLGLMALMALAGVRRGVPPSAGTAPGAKQAAVDLPPEQPSRPYAVVLIGGLVLFYAAVILLLAALVAAFAAIIFLILNGGLSFTLYCGLAVPGILAWVYLTMLYSPRRRDDAGIGANPADCTRLQQVVDEITHRVGADKVDEVRLTIGSAIRLQPVGRGPFGIFGGKRQVLSLGFAALRYLTVGELQSLLAQQASRLSSSPGSASRFVTLARLRIEQTLDDISQAGGKGNYINPFYIFLEMYYRTYSLFAGSYHRIEVLNADRSSAVIYGSDTLTDALMKVNVDAPLLSAKVHKLVEELLPEVPDLSNMYGAWEELCNEALTTKERKAIQTEAKAQEKGYTHLAITTQDRDRRWEAALSRSDSHWHKQPTLRERLDVIAALPKNSANPGTALELFDNIESIEEQLTEFATQGLTERKEPSQVATPAAK